jgi:hypothetical protein
LHAGSFLFAEVKMFFFAAAAGATLIQPAVWNDVDCDKGMTLLCLHDLSLFNSLAGRSIQGLWKNEWTLLWRGLRNSVIGSLVSLDLAASRYLRTHAALHRCHYREFCWSNPWERITCRPRNGKFTAKLVFRTKSASVGELVSLGVGVWCLSMCTMIYLENLDEFPVFGAIHFYDNVQKMPHRWTHSLKRGAHWTR